MLSLVVDIERCPITERFHQKTYLAVSAAESIILVSDCLIMDSLNISNSVPFSANINTHWEMR